LQAEDILQNCNKVNFEANLVHNFGFSNNSKIFQHLRSIAKSAYITTTVFFDDTSTTQDIDKATLFNRCFYISQNTYQFEDMPSTNSTVDSISFTEEEATL